MTKRTFLNNKIQVTLHLKEKFAFKIYLKKGLNVIISINFIKIYLKTFLLIKESHLVETNKTKIKSLLSLV